MNGNPFAAVEPREQAESLPDIDVTETAQEEGIRNPVFITQQVYESCIKRMAGQSPEHEEGRLRTLLATVRWVLHNSNWEIPKNMWRFIMKARTAENEAPREVMLLIRRGLWNLETGMPPVTVVLESASRILLLTE